uniref:Uncharacterized protein n=1 Tax=Tanacetum cinerariifolium TaxID=118510 RepID=A0A6L2MNB2_TANCI|nr:hypothetical protein [Tanacetum cinerariifolium]
MDTCTTLTRRVEHLELDKIAQALEITKSKQRVKKLERRNKLKVLKLRRLKRVGSAQSIDTSDDTVMDDVSKQGGIIANIDANEDVVLEDAKDVVEKSADVEDNADDQGRKAESQAEIYKIDLEHAKKVLSMHEEESEQAELQEVVDVVTTAKIITKVVTAASDIITAASTAITAADVLISTATTAAAAPTLTATPSRRRKEVVIRDPQETTTTSTIIHSEAKFKDKGKGILVKKPNPLRKQAQIEQDEKYARELEAELNKNIDWDEVTDHVKRKQKEGNTKEHMDEEDSRALKRLNESQEEKAAKKQKLDKEVEELKRHLQIVPMKKMMSTHKLPILLARVDLEALWSLVKERFATTKPKNFSNDFLLITLGAMFEKPDIHAQIYKNQRSVHGQAKVKSWKLLESCGVQIITFTTTQLILLVERRYLLIRFTLNQMLNNVQLEVEEESEVSLELLRAMSSPNHPTSDIEDAFSSTHSPNYTPALPSYFPASPENTSPDPLDDYLIPIPPPIIVPPSPMLSPIFNPQEFFVPEELLPPKEQVSHLTSSSTDLSNPSRKQACILVPPSFSVYTPTPPQIFEIGKSSIKMHLKHHEKQIEDILNYLEELSFHRIEKMEERLVNGGMIIQIDFDELKTELEKVHSQISRLQKKHIGQKDKTASARFRIPTLEITLKDIQARY